jgi:hypothetical protein
MKKVLMLSLAILMVASYAMADDIGVYTDQAGTDCDFVATGIGPLTVYVVHHTAGATGSQFKVVNTSSWSFSASVLGGFLSIGDAFSDLSLAYGGCNAGPAIAVVALNGFTFPFPGAPCGQITVQAAPNKVGVIGVDWGGSCAPRRPRSNLVENRPVSQNGSRRRAGGFDLSHSLQALRASGDCGTWVAPPVPKTLDSQTGSGGYCPRWG